MEVDFKSNLGLQKLFIDMGFENFTFDWLVNREMAIYTIVIAGVWQSAGSVSYTHLTLPTILLV